MNIVTKFKPMASIIGYSFKSSLNSKAQPIPVMEKISSIKNDGGICLSKATGRKMLLKLRPTQHDTNIEFKLSDVASIIGYRMGKISSSKSDGAISHSKATGEKKLSQLQSSQHDMNTRISKRAANKINDYLQWTHNPANKKRVRFDV